MQNKTTLNPYLTFEGNCREAMEFYKTVFGGKLEMMTFEGSPVEVPEDYKQKIMHATIRFDDAVLMASDGQPGQSIDNGNSIYMMVNAASLELAKVYFDSLSNGGKVIMPMDKTFWGSMFGMLTDKFGIGWMISHELPQS